MHLELKGKTDGDRVLRHSFSQIQCIIQFCILSNISIQPFES